jgi:diguanylate cyclase (GGDEF)-like protein
MSEPRTAATAADAGRRLWRLHALVVAVLLTGAGCLTVALQAAVRVDGTPALWRLALLALVLLVGESTVLNLRFGQETYTFTWSEAAIIVGLFLVPWPWLTVVAPLAVAVVHTVARRDLVKVVFNAASMATGATAAQLACWLVADGRPVRAVDTVLGCVALAVAATVGFTWNSLTVSGAVAFSSGRSFVRVVRKGITLKLAVLAGNTIVALLLVTAPWRGSTVILVPFSVLLLYLVYRSYLRALDERDIWQQLDRTAKEISSLDEGEVAVTAVARAAELFGAEVVELAVVPPAGAPVHILVQLADGTQTLHEDDRQGAVSPAASWVVTPLEGVNGLEGSLRLGFPVPTELTQRQRHVLKTFVHGVSTSLQNARLYGEMRALADRYAREARHDPLTGLANRKFLYEHAMAELRRADRDGTEVGLLLIDLDHFKEINDTLGHGAGDEVLRTVAGRLKGALRRADLVARLGGDEFAVLVCGMASADQAETVARDLLPLFAEPVDHEGLRLAVEGSIGVAVYPDDGTTIDDLLRRADVALYQAKQSRGAYSRYSKDRDESNVDRLTLVADLRNAIAEHEFLLHFQPQVDLRTGRVVGAEVLARWQHARRGLLAPQDFISAIEHSGMMREFTLHILERAVAECAGWREDGSTAAVSVNLSARNLHDRGLPSDVARILAVHGLPADRLLLEITETTMVSDVEAVQEVLAGLRKIGIELSVDDFGTGYSSLALLQRIAVNELKVDRSFVQAMCVSDGDAAIVRATIELAHSLGLRVVAEGVETAEHVRALRALGCDLAQGWHFGKPADGGHMRKLLGLPQAGTAPAPVVPAGAGNG